MPSAYATRMSKRMSTAPRLSIIMSGDEVIERKTSIKEFLSNHVKTIATLVMILGTILCIVLIVMVHKWNYEHDQAERIQACLDVAVIGSGVSGSYAAWRLRHSNLRVDLFEMESVTGGRFQTWRPDAPLPLGIHGELGALFYLPQRHPLFNSTIHALKLTPKEWPRPSPGQHTLYLRGKEGSRTTVKNQGKLPYSLPADEYELTPQQLKNTYLNNMLSDGANLQRDPLSAKNKADEFLYQYGFWNVLSTATNLDGLQLMEDTARWRSFADNGNAALLSSLDYDPSYTHASVEEGMDEVILRLVGEFRNASGKHGLKTNQRLGCITKGLGYYDAMFISTDRDGKDMRKSQTVCAKNIILALPPPALRSISWKRFTHDGNDDNDHEDREFQRRLHSIESLPAFVAYFVYKEKFWGRRSEPQQNDMTTDLPVHWVRYVGKTSDLKPDLGNSNDSTYPEYDVSTTRYLFMVANTDSKDYNYFRSLLTMYVYDGHSKLICKNHTKLVKEISNQIANVYGVDAKTMPLPEAYMIKDWDAARYRWRTGIKWDTVSQLISRPRPDERVYVVGDAYCPGQCQLWADGALQTVENLLSSNLTDFHVSVPSDS